MTTVNDETSRPQTAACSDPRFAVRRMAYQAGALAESEREDFERHVAGCNACRVDLARFAPVAEALGDVLAERVPIDACMPALVSLRASPTESRPPRWIGRAAAAVLLFALGAGTTWLASRSPSPRETSPASSMAATTRIAEFDAAGALHDHGRFAAARERCDALLRTGREREVLFLAGLCRAELGDVAAAEPLYREALATEFTLVPGTLNPARWNIWAHLADLELAKGAEPEHRAELARILREEVTGDGPDETRHRGRVWAAAAETYLLRDGDRNEGRRALERALVEDRAMAAALRKAGDVVVRNHYVLHAQFLYAEAVDASSESGRDVAREVFVAKCITAAQPWATQRGSYVANGLEFLAAAETLADRRGDPARLDLAESYLDTARALRAIEGNEQGLAWSLGASAALVARRGRPADALRFSEDGLAAAERSQDPSTLLDARIVRAQILVAAGAPEGARPLVDGIVQDLMRTPDARRSLSLRALELALARNQAEVTAARASLEDLARRSPLEDVRKVAARVLRGDPTLVGANDLGFRL